MDPGSILRCQLGGQCLCRMVANLRMQWPVPKARLYDWQSKPYRVLGPMANNERIAIPMGAYYRRNGQYIRRSHRALGLHTCEYLHKSCFAVTYVCSAS